MSCSDDEILESECKELSDLIRMTGWEEALMFLGCEIEYGDGVILLRFTAKIYQVRDKYEEHILMYNPKRRKRVTWLPSNALDSDDCFTEDKLAALDDDMTTDYRGIVGALNFISLLRPDAKFPQHVVAGRMQKPREWDMFCIIWYLEYMVGTADYPLVLGGPEVNINARSDASFAIMSEKRSIKSHFVRTGPLSGAIESSVDTIRAAVDSIWDAEVMATSDAINTLLYCENVGNELEYPMENEHNVDIDSASGIDWFESSKISQRSRHVQIKYYKCKHLVQEGAVNICFVEGEHNEADILTKVLAAARLRKLTRMILGHVLVSGLGYEGVLEDESQHNPGMSDSDVRGV